MCCVRPLYFSGEVIFVKRPQTLSMTADSDPASNNISHQSGGVGIDAQRDVTIGGDVVGRDKIEQHTTNTTFDQREQTVGTQYNVAGNLNVTPASRSVTVEEYLTAVREYCSNLPYFTLQDIHPSKTLDEVYVPLRARTQPHNDSGKPTEEQARLEREVFHIEPLSIADVMQQREATRVLIIGESGAGKSTLLRQMAERAWDAPQVIGLNERHLPLLVPLRQLASIGGSLINRLTSALTEELSLPRSLPEDFLDEWSQQTGAHWLILFDALDEVQDKDRARLMQWLKGQLPHLHQHRVVITSRPAGYKGDFDVRTFSHYDLLPFTPEQADELARKWFAEKASTFLQELDRIRTSDFRSTPLLLTIAAKVFGERDALPERRSELYRQCVMIWLDEARQRDEKRELSERFWNIAVFVLARLALAMIERPGHVSERPVSRVVEDYLGEALEFKKDEAEVNSHQIVSVLGRRSGVFMKRGDEYRFFHPAIRDYLAAVAVVRTCKDDLECAWEGAISRWQKSDWREVSLFVLGLLSDDHVNVTPILHRIKWAESKEATYFAGMAMREEVEVPSDLAGGIIEALIVVAQESYWEALTTLTLLEEIRAYPQALEGLRTLALSERVHPWVRAEAAEVLGERGYVEEAAYAWMSLVRDGQADSSVLQESVEAFFKLRRNNELLTLARDKEVDSKLRVQAAKALYQLGFENELMALVHDRKADAYQRVQAIEVLRQFKRTTELLALLRDETEHLRARLQAAEALGQTGQCTVEDVLDLLALACRTKADANLNQRLVIVLHSLMPNGELLPLVYDEQLDASVKLLIIEALGLLGRENDLLLLAHDGKLGVRFRIKSGETLGGLGHGEGLVALARDKQLTGKSRLHSVEALVRLGYGESLMALACDEQLTGKLRLDSAEALGKLGRGEGLMALVRDEQLTEKLRVRSVEALVRLGYGERLVALACDEQLAIELRVHCAEALGKLGHGEILMAFACDEQLAMELRVYSVEALGRLRREDNLFTLARDEKLNARLRIKSAETLGKLGRKLRLSIQSRR